MTHSRWLLRIFVATALLLQYPLWFGSGGVMALAHIRGGIHQQAAENLEFRQRNDSIAARVEDLKAGIGAVEGVAREDLGMIRGNETFLRIVQGP